MSMFVPDLSNEPALTMVRMHNDLTRRLLVIRVIMINALLSGLFSGSSKTPFQGFSPMKPPGPFLWISIIFW